MTTAVSLHLGLNCVSPAVYGSDCKLTGCVNDAKKMSDLAYSLGYETHTLTDREATKSIFDALLTVSASRLKPGDIFLLTYSGHGSQVLDTNGDESDGLDETWCLFDGQIVDDDLYRYWSCFREGVRLVIVSDSCHSGTVARGADSPIQIEEIIGKDIGCKATGVLLSGCRDSQVSYDAVSGGFFTSALLDVWNKGKFVGSYATFVKAIAAKLGKLQSPNYLTFGKPDSSFFSQVPFKF